MTEQAERCKMVNENKLNKRTQYYYDLILKDKPTSIETSNPFLRRCIYTAVERINESTNLNIKCEKSIKFITFDLYET